MSSPAPRLYVDPPPPRHDPQAFRPAAPRPVRPARPAGPAGPRKDRDPTRGGGTRSGGRPPRGPGGSAGGSGGGGPRRPPAPLGLRLALLPLRLALVPLRLAGMVLGRLTGGRPWLALVLVLGCGVIFVHAATLKTNQLIEQREAQIAALERSTASLRNEVAELGSTDRIGRVGREAGMVFPDPEGIGYLDARKARAEQAARSIRSPSASWQPAPNPSTQNGDVLNADGTLAVSGVDSAATQGDQGATVEADPSATAEADPSATAGAAEAGEGTAAPTGQAADGTGAEAPAGE